MLGQLYAPGAGVRTLVVGGRSLLYSEHQQQVLELNETADEIWRALAMTGSAAAAARELVRLGIDRHAARKLVEDAASQWTLGGYLAPRALDELLDGGAPPDRVIVRDELAVELRLRGVGCEALDAVFGHLYGRPGGPRRRISIIAYRGQLLFYLERRLVAAGDGDALAAHLKAILTELYADGVKDAFLTHGALLMKGGRRLLLSGQPGAGKTTLALALAATGWAYGGDDIVRIRPDGAARGVPFAATVKSGGVALLDAMWPELKRLPAWARADGQQARYFLPPHCAIGPAGPLDIVVTLARQPGVAARAELIPPLDGLAAIVNGAYARRWQMTGDALCDLAESLERATCLELHYSDLGPAVRAIEEAAGVAVQAA